MAEKKRTAFYDNLKFILIALVLIGHFTGPLADDSHSLKAFWRWIYMFHMPAFLFIGGVFAKKLCTPNKGLRINVLAFYLLMFVVLYTGLWAEGHLWKTASKFDLFNVGSIPWYFAAMAELGASTPIVSKIRGGAKTVIPAAIAVAVIVPFNDNFGDFLCLGRICAYAPFYFAGYFTDISGFVGRIENLKKRKWPVACAIIIMVALFLFLRFGPSKITGTMSGLATGHNTYDAMKSFPSHIDAIIRFCDIWIAAAMIIALSLVTPTRESFITSLGSRTLQVYFIHPFIYYPLKGFKTYALLQPAMPWAGIAVIVASVFIAIILAVPKWPEALFRKLRSSIAIDNNP